MNKQQFSNLLFHGRRRPEDFDMVIRFAAKAKHSLQLQEHMLFACLAIHSLDLEKLYTAAIIDILPAYSLNVQNAIDLLSGYFDTYIFHAQHCHYNLTIITKALTSIVQQFFQHSHPELYQNLKQIVGTQRRSRLAPANRKNQK
jgi:hypothetical protein